MGGGAKCRKPMMEKEWREKKNRIKGKDEGSGWGWVGVSWGGN